MAEETRLSTQEVRNIALLARVGMTDEETELMRGQLSNILESIDRLRQVDTVGVEPTGHSVELRTVMRQDESRASRPRDELLANAPRLEGEFIRVRAVLE